MWKFDFVPPKILELPPVPIPITPPSIIDGIAGMPFRAGSSSSVSLSLLHLGGNRFKEGGMFAKAPAVKAMKAACKAKKVRVQDCSF